MGRKLTVEFIKSEFEKEGYQLLTKEYRNSKQKLEYICPKGHRDKISWSNWQQGGRCSCFRKKRKTIEFICENCGGTYKLKRTPNRGRPKLCGMCLKNEANERVKNTQYHKKPEYKLKSREWRLKNYYGLSMEDYKSMLERQNGVCAICKRSTSGDRGKYLVVDHSHHLNKVRGLLCDKCNRAIGSFGDNFTILQNAILYLIRAEGDKSWDRYFINIAALVSTRSKDVSVQVGAVLVKDNIILSTGYNGFPRKCDDDNISKYDRPLKYKWTIHAEANTLLNAGREGISTLNSTIYVTPIRPCSGCVKAMIQCGVKRIVCQVLFSANKWDEEFEISKQMIHESGIDYVELT